MTLADIIILLILGVLLFTIIFYQVKHRDKKACSTCAYSKK